MNATIRVLGPDDADVLGSVARDVFDEALDPKLVSEFLADARHHIAVAVQDGRVIGFVSAVHYVNPDKPAELWLNEVCVSPAHQGRGIGRRLVATMLNVGRELGCVNAWVLTDSTNDAAKRLYQSAGGEEASVPSVMFEFELKSRAT